MEWPGLKGTGEVPVYSTQGKAVRGAEVELVLNYLGCAVNKPAACQCETGQAEVEVLRR